MSLTAEALWSIPRVGTPEVARDFVVVPVTRYSDEPGPGVTRLWHVPLDGSDPRPLTAPAATKPALSADGSRLAFLRPVDGISQVHVMPTNGGEPEAITDLPLGATGMRWFPDGMRLLVIADLFAEALTIGTTAELREERKSSKTSARTTDNAIFRYWDRWLTEGRFPHLFVVEQGHDPIDITPRSVRWMKWDNTGDPTEDLAISPDGAEVAVCFDVSAPPHRELRWSLFTVDVESHGESHLTPDSTGHASSPRYSPDGRYLVYGETIDRYFYADRTRLMRRTRLDGKTIELTEGWDRSPSEWAVGASEVVLVAEDEGRQPIWRLALEGGTPQKLTDEGTLSGPNSLSDGRIVAAHNSLVSPPELALLDANTIERLTFFTEEALEGIELPTREEFRFEGARGDAVQGWLVRPASLDTPAPLVHMIHGGPHGTFADTWHWRWNAPVFCGDSRMAALVNFHGSTGFGQEFAECIRGEWGDLPAADIEMATDHLVESGDVDAERMAITGGSYGGYMVAWLTSQTTRYRCAIAHAAVTSLPGMYASDITTGQAYAFGADVWEDLERVNKWSPAAHAAGYTTPTLVIHGELDYRVPITQGLEYYGVLKAKEVEARLVYYPDENHWILSQANSIHWYGEVVDWLDRHLG